MPTTRRRSLGNIIDAMECRRRLYGIFHRAAFARSDVHHVEILHAGIEALAWEIDAHGEPGTHEHGRRLADLRRSAWSASSDEERIISLRVGIEVLIRDIEAARDPGTDGRAVRTWKGPRR